MVKRCAQHRTGFFTSGTFFHTDPVNPQTGRPAFRTSYRYLIGWVGLGLASGLAGSTVLAAFTWLVDRGSIILLAGVIPPPAVAVGAALVVGFLLYRLSPNAAGEGIPSYLYALNHGHARFPGLVTLLKFPAGVLTLAAFGSGGVVGPVGRVSAGLVSLLGPLRKDPTRREELSRTAAICGLAATVAALFHAPIGGGVFAVEVIQRENMRYRDLFPAVLAAAASVGFSRLMGWAPLISLAEQPILIELGFLPWSLAFAVLVGLLASLYVRGYGLTVQVFRRDRGAVALKVIIGMAGSATLVWLVNPAFFGTASAVTASLASGELGLLRGNLGAETPIVVIALTMPILRLVASFLTTGSGMSAGLTAPAVQIGMLAAVLANEGVTAIGARPMLGPFLAVGFAGMLAGSMNVPIAAAILAVEIFGTGLAVPAVFASVVGFQMNRHTTIYDFALAGSGRLRGAGPTQAPSAVVGDE
jgi:CIC family chloride channel protein